MIGIGPNLARRPTANIWSSGADMDFMFAEDASVVPRAGRSQLQCTRAGDTATVFNRYGVLETVLANMPRLNHDPSVLRFHNELLWSEEFSAWTRRRCTVASNVVLAPDGRVSADKLVEDTSAASSHYVESNFVTFDDLPTGSVYVKAGERTQAWVQIPRDNGAASASSSCNIDLVTGQILSGSGATATYVGDGWWRLTVTATSVGSNYAFRVGTVLAGASGYTGDGSSGIYIWGAQLNSSAAALPYRRTGATPRAKEYACRGLLVEEARTNKIQYPRDFTASGWNHPDAEVIADAAQAPDGTLTADLYRPAAVSSNQRVERNWGSANAGDVFTASVYAKAAGYSTLSLRGGRNATSESAVFDLVTGIVTYQGSQVLDARAIPCGNGWFRCTVTVNIASTNVIQYLTISKDERTAFVGDGVSGIYIWHAQLEAGYTATSPTIDGTAAITRNGEIPATVVAPRQEFTLLADFYAPSADVSRVVLTIHDGTVNNRVSLRITAGVLALVVVVGGATHVSIGLGVLTPGARYKVAARVKQDDFAASVNGAAAVIDNVGAIPVATNLGLGFDTTGAYFPLNSTLVRVARFPYGASNPDLQQLTA